MARYTVYCEECVEEIPSDEVLWDEGRLYCKRCGSEVERPEGDVFEEIVDNRSRFLFRNENEDYVPEDVESDDEEEEEGAVRDEDP